VWNGLIWPRIETSGWVNNIKMNLRDYMRGRVEWITLAKDVDNWLGE
jgi:hypothetical protein